MKNERFQLCMLSLWPLTSFNFRNSPYVLGRIWTVTNFSASLCVGGSSYETCFEGYKMFRVKVLIICCGFVGIFKLNSKFSVLLCILSSSMFFFLHTLYLFLSVLIVISGDVVHSPLWDRYSKISAENPERSFTQSQYKHGWKCVFCMCVFNNPTKSPNMEKRIHLKLIVLTVLIYTVMSILALMDTFWI